MNFPSNLAELASKRITELTLSSPEHLDQWQGGEKILLEQSIALSDFIHSALMQDNELLIWLRQHLQPDARQMHYRAKLKQLLVNVVDENQLSRVLRRFRRQEMLWLAWQDFNNNLPLNSCLTHLSALAEAITLAAYHWLYAKCSGEWGTPCNDKNIPQPMLILGMGKLGGAELNFSSDIDLIFTYPEDGQTQGARNSIANAQFFTRLGQRLIKALSQQSVDGFCYRVDMRLRPFGDSGPLVMSFAALEEYYQEQGRDWERYAMIKARVLGKEQLESYQQLRQLLRPFVFRRYIDFSAIESLRRMKTSIQAEVRRRGLYHNIKLGFGGIREIEFIAQSFQLIRGGREPLLRQRGLLATLAAIQSLALLTKNEVDTLVKTYCYLRRVENLLQAINDRQTQTLPDNAIDQARLAFALQKPNWPTLKAEIETHMANAHLVFSALVGSENEQDTTLPKYQELWDACEKSEIENQAVASVLFTFKHELAKRTIGARGRDVLQQLMPMLLAKTLMHADDADLLQRILHLLNQILTRTTYLELLNEHPSAVAQLVKLCAASPMVAEQIAAFPMLLDELLDPAHLYSPIAVQQYRSELFEYLARIPKEDMEQQMDQIRQFKQSQLLRIAAADIVGALPIMQVSDHLTYLAEAIIDAIVQQAWEQMTQKFGIPEHLAADDYGFAIIAYGKLGGLELSYGSDLDLVFVHDCPESSTTKGENSINSRQFYSRLVQRIIHLFSTRTRSGVLYEIDMRLRPSGNSGMLITSLSAFEQYQQHDAWVWEHQALVRARVVYGAKRLQQEFEHTRARVLGKKRNSQELKHAVVAMREKMREHLATKSASNQAFDLKQDLGCIVDIEFITQYLTLAHANTVPALMAWTDNIRILNQAAEANILPPEQVQQLQQAYTNMRNEAHRLALLNQSAMAVASLFSQEREQVSHIWQQLFK